MAVVVVAVPNELQLAFGVSVKLNHNAFDDVNDTTQ
jgi:hypothetical protein